MLIILYAIWCCQSTSLWLSVPESAYEKKSFIRDAEEKSKEDDEEQQMENVLFNVQTHRQVHIWWLDVANVTQMMIVCDEWAGWRWLNRRIRM